MKIFTMTCEEIFVNIFMTNTVQAKMDVFINHHHFVITSEYHLNYGYWRYFVQDKSKTRYYVATFNSLYDQNAMRLDWFCHDIVNDYDDFCDVVCFFPYSNKYYKQKYVQFFRINFLPVLQKMRNLSIMAVGI